MKTRIICFVSLLLLGIVLAPSPLRATSFVRASDERLADRAAAIIEARVLDVDPAPGAAMPMTDYLVEVEDLIAGYVPASSVVVRVPGGTRDDGLALHIEGAPRFTAGQRVLLFLDARTDDTFRIVHLMQGAFLIDDRGGERIARRELAGAHEIQLPGRGAQQPETPRNLERFRAWLIDRAAGLERPADYRLEPSEAGVPEKYTLLGPARWREFDTGGSIRWRAHEDGLAGQPGGGFDELKTALALWTNESHTPIRYSYAGTTTASGGLTSPDGVNAILFGDPNGIMPPYNCVEGTLAMGGFWYTMAEQVHNGTTFWTIMEGDIVTARGIECELPGNELAEELFAHELGHTLGLGHSGDSNALMYPFIHGDGRGARLGGDDVEGITFIYGTPPDAPSDLTATALDDRIRLSWRDNSGDESSFQIERRTTGSFGHLRTVGANSRQYDDASVSPGITYCYRVRARNGAGESDYTDEACATIPIVVEPCEPGPTTMCLWGDRFRVETTWHDFEGVIGDAWVLPFGSVESGLYWFFSQNNWEMLIKVLDGCAINDRYWVFAAVTTDVEYTLEVTDTWTGQTSTYFNPLGVSAAAITDSDAFRTCGASPPAGSSSSGLRSAFATEAPARPDRAHGPVADEWELCPQSLTEICLGQRFKVEVEWQDYVGATGPAKVVPVGSEDSGLFWFFSPNNWEMLIKVLDGCAINDRYWVFSAATTDVAYTLRVTDTLADVTQEYHNSLGVASPAITDTDAFATCP
ncbi:MAG: matrixin family metalloprotease [bacterium]|nr:matrixin family metalloprotease [bacterium]